MFRAILSLAVAMQVSGHCLAEPVVERRPVTSLKMLGGGVQVPDEPYGAMLAKVWQQVGGEERRGGQPVCATAGGKQWVGWQAVQPEAQRRMDDGRRLRVSRAAKSGGLGR